MFKLFDDNKRALKKLDKKASEIESLESKVDKLSDEELKAKTNEFKERYNKGESLDDLKTEAFSVVREAAKRVLELHPYKVQIMGSLALHEGDIAEMKTGEGKTLTATMAVYLNALSGKGVHVVTVNEYLAERDYKEMGELYEWLGLTVKLNASKLSPQEKREAYLADITYSTNSELGFDYLRDNMVKRKQDKVQRPLNFAIIDEVDSILIDEARTPLIVSEQAEAMGKLFTETNKFMKLLTEDDYVYNEENNEVLLTDAGIKKAEVSFKVDNLYDVKHQNLNHAIDQSLKAHKTVHENKDYVVKDNEILIVDSLTGRLMEGRRYSGGLHQAIEAKEGLKVKKESRTIATITFQNFFRKYAKLAGMTGTAKTEEEEFRNIYNMQVVVIPTNKPIVREDKQDVVYSTLEGKYKAIINEVKSLHEKGQPVLIGTVSIETSEVISRHLKKHKIRHNVLNAKNHKNEAQIIAEAGQRGAVTVATNMAGRGTDIKPGPGVLELGGLVVIGTERHESRRIDDQLRGRTGRQGNPGSTQFYLSSEDNLMIRLGSEKMKSMLDILGFDDQPIKSKMVSKAVESSQKQAEGLNFDTRKSLLQYDDVLSEQRELIYKERDIVLNTENTRPIIENMIDKTIDEIVELFTQGDSEEWDLDGLEKHIESNLLGKGEIMASDLADKTQDEIKTFIREKAYKEYEWKESKLTPESMRTLERDLLLYSIDSEWVSHIESMEDLRQGVHLRAYAQIDPLKEYESEGFSMFESTMNSISANIARYILKSKLKKKEK